MSHLAFSVLPCAFWKTRERGKAAIYRRRVLACYQLRAMRVMFPADDDAVSDLESRMEELVRTQADLKEQLGSACSRADKGKWPVSYP